MLQFTKSAFSNLIPNCKRCNQLLAKQISIDNALTCIATMMGPLLTLGHATSFRYMNWILHLLKLVPLEWK